MENVLEIPIGFIGKIFKVNGDVFSVGAEGEYTFSSRLISPELLMVGNFVYWGDEKFALASTPDTSQKY